MRSQYNVASSVTGGASDSGVWAKLPDGRHAVPRTLTSHGRFEPSSCSFRRRARIRFSGSTCRYDDCMWGPAAARPRRFRCSQGGPVLLQRGLIEHRRQLRDDPSSTTAAAWSTSKQYETDAVHTR